VTWEAVWDVLKWILLVLAAGFIGQFGRALAMRLIERRRRNRSEPTPSAPPPTELEVERERLAAEAKIAKKRAKAEVKKAKKSDDSAPQAEPHKNGPPDVT
jgi:hypothetical protein